MPASTRRSKTGSIDFVDDLANIVPAVLTWRCWDPAEEVEFVQRAGARGDLHAGALPDIERVTAMHREMGLDMVNNMLEIRENPRPGIVNGLLQMRIDGEPAPDLEILVISAWSSAVASTPRPR